MLHTLSHGGFGVKQSEGLLEKYISTSTLLIRCFGAGNFPKMHEHLICFVNVRHKMQPHHAVLCLQSNRAEPEQFLNNAVLRFHHVLQHREIDALMIVDEEQCFFDAVNFAIGGNNDIEKVSVETREEFNVGEKEEHGKERQERPARERILDWHGDKGEVSESRNQYVPCNKLCERPQEPYGMLITVKVQLLIGMLPLEIHIGQ